MCWWFFELAIWWLLHKTVRFLCSENGKCLFGAIKRKTSSCNIVCQAMMHMFAQYGHIITNYALILAITLVILPESQETSNEIGHFVKEIELELKYRMQLIVSYIKND